MFAFCILKIVQLGGFVDSMPAKLRMVRKARGFKTAKEFATKNNIPLSTYAMHETGRRGLKIKVAKLYCSLLGMELNWFLLGKNTPGLKYDRS